MISKSSTTNAEVKQSTLLKDETLQSIVKGLAMAMGDNEREDVLVQEEVLMKYFSGLIQASFGTAQSTKRTNGHMKVHWRVSVSQF